MQPYVTCTLAVTVTPVILNSMFCLLLHLAVTEPFHRPKTVYAASVALSVV
jgi:hypothetical protein